MNLARVATAIKARLEADSTLTSLVPASRIMFGAMRGATFTVPYIVFQLSDAEQDTFTDDGSEVEIEFRIVASTVAASGGLTTPSTIIDRIKGDAMLQAGRVPSYGFHRHTLVLGSGGENYVGGPVARTGGEVLSEVDPDYTVFVERYQVLQSAPATSP